MTRFIVYRLLQAVVVIWAIFTITFFMTRAAPGGPFSNERQVSEHIQAQIDEYYGLDKHILVQYGQNLWRLLRGDFGPSYKYEGRSVNEIIADGLPISAALGALSLLAALVIGIPVGVVAAKWKNTTADYVPMAAAMAGICLPTFVMGPLLAIVFGIKLQWFNVALWMESTDWVLPALTLGLYYAAYVARLSRSGMLETLSQDFVRTARAKGVSEFQVVVRHSLKSGLLPVIAFLGPAFAGLISGSFVVEKIFRIPGLGQHFVEAALNRDYTLVQGTAVLYGIALVLLNLAVDLVQVWMNPRLRFSQ